MCTVFEFSSQPCAHNKPFLFQSTYFCSQIHFGISTDDCVLPSQLYVHAVCTSLLCAYGCACVCTRSVRALPRLTSLTVGCCEDLFSALSGWLWIKCIFRHLFALFFFPAVPLSTQLELRSGHTNRQTDRQTRARTHTHTRSVSEKDT